MAFITMDSFAITGRDNWGDIRRSDEVMIQQPTFAGIFGPEGLFNACTTDDEFKSIKPVKNCLEYREVIRQSETGKYRDYVCTFYETKPISISRTYIRNICVKHAVKLRSSAVECIQYESVTMLYPTTFSFAVIDTASEEYGNYLFSKTFALQSCD